MSTYPWNFPESLDACQAPSPACADAAPAAPTAQTGFGYGESGNLNAPQTVEEKRDAFREIHRLLDRAGDLLLECHKKHDAEVKRRADVEYERDMLARRAAVAKSLEEKRVRTAAEDAKKKILEDFYRSVMAIPGPGHIPLQALWSSVPRAEHRVECGPAFPTDVIVEKFQPHDNIKIQYADGRVITVLGT